MDSRYYGPIHQSGLQAGMAYYMPEQPMPPLVTLKSPAIEVMTDLNRVGAATITADVPIATAEKSMKVHAVRSLMVIDEARRLLGVITATDLLGEKPLKLSWERGLRRGEITVRHLMTPADRLDVIEMDNVRLACVGNVLETLRQSARQHALVVDRTTDGHHLVRGVFSTTQIARQLGMTLPTDHALRSFAEIEQAIGP